jgi:hypothetical protein
MVNAEATSIDIQYNGVCYPQQSPHPPLPPGTPTNSRVCAIFIGQSERFSLGAESCYEILFSMFLHLSVSGSGGAILQSSSAIFIQDSTFDDCSCSESGGAIAAFGPGTEVLRSCFLRCEADVTGSVFATDATTFAKLIADSNVCGCGNTLGPAAINLNSAVTFRWDRANATSAGRSGQPSAVFRSQIAGSRWTLAYSTVFGCMGTTALESASTGTRPFIEFSNFYNNTGVFSAGLFSAETLGFKLDHCIVSGTSGYNFHMNTASVPSGYELSNCVLDAELPASNLLFAAVDVLANTITDSFDLNLFNECYYPVGPIHEATNLFTLPGFPGYAKRQRIIKVFSLAFLFQH